MADKAVWIAHDNKRIEKARRKAGDADNLQMGKRRQAEKDGLFACRHLQDHNGDPITAERAGRLRQCTKHVFNGWKANGRLPATWVGS